MTEYLCLTLLAEPSETEAAFKSRLTVFWTHMIRNRESDYERVYAEAKAFETENGRVCRRYMIEPEAASVLSAELTANKLDFVPLDEDELYSRAEASASEWFQIPHD